MGIAYNTKTVRDGLILHLDAANPKSYSSGSLDVEYLIVAGGGAGGDTDAGGGGAGGVLIGKTKITPQNYTVTVGAGAPRRSVNDTRGENGQNSSAFGFTAIGGGGGGAAFDRAPAQSSGGNGGSGGGGGTDASTAGLPTAGQGNAGGTGVSGVNGGGGGGGAGQPGQNGPNGNGGFGIISRITGTATVYGDGGGGGHGNTTTGGSGRGGQGFNGGAGTDGEPNSGSGGGGGGGSFGDGGAGGSGIIVVRYIGPQRATGGDNIYEKNGYTVHVFNNSGNLVVGGAAGDISGNQNTGALTNGVGFDSANNGSFAFDGTDSYIGISGLTDTAEKTYSIWAILPTTGQEQIFSVGNNASTCIGLTFNSTRDGNSQVVASSLLYNTTGNTGSYGVTSGITTNTWHNFVITTNSSGNVTALYIDAVSYPSRTQTSRVYNIETSLRLGTRSDNNFPYSGKSAQFSIYNRVLTAAEVEQNFNAARDRYGI